MTDRKTAIRRITDSELLELPFGSKIKVVWHNSPHHSKNSEYCGVIFGNKIGYEDGFVDSVRTIAECMFNDWCMVYILDEKNLSNINLSVTIRNDNVAHEMYCKGVDDFVKASRDVVYNYYTEQAYIKYDDFCKIAKQLKTVIKNEN